MKKPIYNEELRFLIRNSKTYQDRLLLDLSIQKLKREIVRILGLKKVIKLIEKLIK